jgi:uncharacterized protein YdeI (YjbR/CyaY-like superfamily)
MKLEIPEYIQIALDKHPREGDFFKQLDDTQRKEYVEWVNDPQLEDQRQRRLQEMLESLKDGKKGPRE